MNTWSKIVLAAVAAGFLSTTAIVADEAAKGDKNKCKGEHGCKGKGKCKGKKHGKKETAPKAEEAPKAQ